ncbi:PucR family transcriptional regulator [Streptomyces sp. NRRL B-1347]|uniref:PucR family transcriptional regulator n=1 Tax=Streptomyces sp. NRRL B-1347 TaxID=1476877 RepID=UPI0004C53657|nr:PucR family transcriptional regulator [Streptomyces sp. NRRL B-1347]
MPSETGAVPPPTPAVPLTALLAHEKLGLRQIAGPDAAAADIHWVHTSEMTDPYPYLLGGELLLTAGVHVTAAAGTGPHLDAYVSRIVAAGGAALGFGVAPVHDTVPRALVEACDRHGLPLLEVPPQTTFSGVARAVWQLMAEARHTELRRVAQAQQGLAAAAARPDPVPALLRQLAARLDGYAALHTADGTPAQSAGAPPGEAALAALARLAGVVLHPVEPRPAPASGTDTVDATHLAAYALAGPQGLALGVATRRREPGDHTVAQVAAVLLALLTADHQGAPESARSAALVRLLLGADPHEVAPLLGADRWTVVHARVQRGSGTPPPTPAALATALGSTLVDAAPEVTTLLLPADREITAQDGWTLGVSAPAAAEALAAADAQAARALRRAAATRVPLVRHRQTGIAALVAPAEADAHARVLLAPLGESPALTETLRTWLSLHGSWDRTAAALSVHRNTVRQRVARCAALLDADLDDPDVRMELWFALKHST